MTMSGQPRNKNNHHHYSRNNVFFILILVLLSLLSSTVGLEATWTPADGESDSSGPLPLSQAQRQQLHQLDQALSQSPNPEETLRSVAEQNGMEADELASMLIRNREDMAMAGGAPAAGGGGSGVGQTLPRQLVKLFWSMVMVLFGYAKREPRRFGWIMGLMFMVLYVTFMAPRNGIILSDGPKPLFLSHGHSTVLSPPRKYISSYLQSKKITKQKKTPSFAKYAKMGISRRLADRLEDFDEDGVTVDKVGRKSKQNSDLASSITVRKTMPIADILPWTDGDDDGEISQEEYNHAHDLAYESALSILSSRRFAEGLYMGKTGTKKVGFQTTKVLTSSPLKTVAAGSRGARGLSSNGKNGGGNGEVAAIICQSMGDWSRYGVQPLRIAYEENIIDTSEAVAFCTLKGGHFDGEIRFSVERIGGADEHDDDDDDEEEEAEKQKDENDYEKGKVIISVSLVIPKKGRKINQKLSQKIITSLASSMVSTATMEAKKKMARQSQSKSYLGKTGGLARERRQIRSDREKKIEEMAQDRRRRWQRNNPNSGSYRPSGDRMRSPKNC